MLTMDLKGITWVGNVYQKFESMCLEMEEAMYEDTVKYVENQMQTVGDNFKTFYSGVIQDLLPSSPIDPVKIPVTVGRKADLKKAINPNTDFKLECEGGDSEQLTEDTEPLIHFVKVEGCHDSYSDSYRSLSEFKKQNLGVEVNPVNESRQPAEISGESHMIKDFSEESSHDQLLHEDPQALCDQLVTNSNPELSKLSDFYLIHKSRVEVENPTECMPVNDDLPPDSTRSMENLPSSGRPDVSYTVSKQGEPTTKLQSNVKLEDSCVLVSWDEFHFSPQKEHSRTSSKKNLRTGFSPRITSSRKHEYKLLALCHGATNEQTKKERPETSTVDLNADICESEWELL